MPTDTTSSIDFSAILAAITWETILRVVLILVICLVVRKVLMNLITRAIGTEPVVLCDIFHHKVERGDYILLCSDGLSNIIDEQEILFEVIYGEQKKQCCQRLLDIAKNRGAPDNVTSVLIQI